MATLTPKRIASLLSPFLLPDELTPVLLGLLGEYLDLLLHWNARMNLTAVRDPEAIVQRHMGESLYAARFLPVAGDLLDFGSGSGFPGIPMQIARPYMHVTLAESQGKKASFLREAVRTLDLGCEVWARRVEEMPVERRFDVVAMRAVDQGQAVIPEAQARVAYGGMLLRFVASEPGSDLPGWRVTDEDRIPVSGGRVVAYGRAE